MHSISCIKLYLTTFAVCMSIDLVWIGILAKNFYQKHLGFLFNESFNLGVGLLFYLLFAAALMTFVLMPALEKESLSKALALGFFFGLTVYSAYDLTNQATIKDWPVIITLVDMAWGATMATLTSGITFFLWTKFYLR